MRALRLVWPLLVGSAGACEKRAPAQQQQQPGSGVAPGDAAPALALVVPDAAPVPVDAAATPDAAGLGSVLNFGCLGWSPQRGIAACVVGQRGYGVGGAKLELVFVAANADTPAPPSITLYDLGDASGPGPDMLADDVDKRVDRALEGFVPWDRKAAVVASFGEGHTQMSGKPVGGMSFKLEVHAVDGLRHRAVLFARGPDGVSHQVTEREGPFPTLDVRAFPLRDRAGHSAVVIELQYPLGDEGVSGELGEIGVCATADCSFP